MTTVAITSDSKNKSLQSLSFERSTTSRDASFSSYLNPGEENFMLRIAEESSCVKSFSAIPDDRLHEGEKNKSDYEGGIDIFPADEYFKEHVGEISPNIVNKDHPPTISSLKQKYHAATPGVHSKSIWNSRSSLLHKQKTDQQPKKMNRTKSFLASIGCKCSCSDKDSVHVDNQINESKAKGYMNQFGRPNSNIWYKKDRLIKKNDYTRHLVAETQDHVRDQVSYPLHDQEERARRLSLEVFGSPIQMKRDKSSSLEKQAGKLASVAAIAKETETEGNSADSREEYNDTDSDVSSDLFEIESFSTNTNINPSLTRQASDGMYSGCASPTTCAPTEVSIQWSTTTTSMADFSVMSDSEELDINTYTKTSKFSKQATNRHPGIGSGIKSYRAVRVAEETHQATDNAFMQDFQKQQKLESSKPTRFHTENEIFTTRKDIQHKFTTQSSTTIPKFKRTPHLSYIH